MVSDWIILKSVEWPTVCSPSVEDDSTLDSSLLKQLEMSLLLGTVWQSHGIKPQLNTLSWKSTHRTLSICVESRAGLSLDHTHIWT